MIQLLSPKQLADMLGVSEQTIYNRHSTRGDLPQAIKIGRLVKFDLKDVNIWLENKKNTKKTLFVATKKRGRLTKAESIARRHFNN